MRDVGVGVVIMYILISENGRRAGGRYKRQQIGSNDYRLIFRACC
jgi:hypothetical protein